MPVNIGVNIQRSPNRINQNLREAGALGKFPKLLLDFKDEYYLANGGSKTFANAVTHARAGNATMTDGYGAELIVNGSFTNDISGWTEETNGDATYSDGKIRVTVVNSTNNGAYQELTTESGKTYIFTALLVDVDSHASATVRVGTAAGTGNLFSSTFTEGVIEFSFTATSSTSYITLRPNSTINGNTAVFDNVSVREMPVIKFAPHNYQRYSDDVSQGAGSTGVTRTATTLTETTSTGEHRIQCGISPPVVGEKYTMAVEAKSGTGSRLLGFRGYGHGGIPNYPVFDIVNGTIETAGANFTDVSITDVGDGYYLCKASVVVDSAFRWSVHMIEDGTPPQHSYTGDGSSSVLLRKLRQYRSDLGGMVDNPDNSGNDADFIATSGSEAYLPRIGHHVYNGNAWVNEGVLAESEARTNLYDNNDSMHTNNLQNNTASANGGTAPDGTDDAVKLLETTATGEHTVLFQESVITTGKTYTCSVFVKSIGGRNAKFGFSGINFPSARRVNFDLNAVTTAEPNFSTIQEVGNGWFRLSVTNTSDTTGTRGDTNALLQPLDGTTISYAGDVTKGLLFYGMQIEEGATPSSYIPTANTTTVTRAAETFTIPSANLPWPTPQYIGSELVTNGDFSNGETGFGEGGDGSGSVSNEEYTIIRGTTADQTLSQAVTTVVGKVYEFSVNVSANTGGKFKVVASGSGTLSDSGYFDLGTTGKISLPFVANTTSTTVRFQQGGGASSTSTFDDFSVREINPLSVSIGMEGRMTYADTGATTQLTFWRHRISNDNYLLARVDTSSTRTGQVDFLQRVGGTSYLRQTTNNAYSPDILVPYNIASRHGSTFINGATDGVELTTTIAPSLPDLSSVDLDLAYGYMGTISEFRVWDKDITDAGIVEATNPSLEPSLSLTFQGTGTNSFVVNDWSE